MPYVRTEEPHFSMQNARQPKHTFMPHASVKHRLLVDARDRPDPANTSPFDFSLSLSAVGVGRYENVTSVELKGLAFPKVQGEPYVVLDIAEFADQLDATNSAAHRTFAVAYFDSTDLGTGAIRPIKGYDFYQKSVEFSPPLRVLDKLTVRFTTHGGNVVQTTATAGNAHASMLLEITTALGRS